VGRTSNTCDSLGRVLTQQTNASHGKRRNSLA
jgi:hypothetical protein